MNYRWARMKWCWKFGLHSNIPTCCVFWFCVVRINLPSSYILLQAWLKDHLIKEIPPPERQYIRCPLCIVRGYWGVQHICNRSCPEPYGSLVTEWNEAYD